MSKWRLIAAPEMTGADNMAYDLKLFSDFEKMPGQPVLRIYSWRPKAISLGYAQKVDREIDLEMAKALGWDVVVRPTGGGIVFHNEAEVTYSLVIGKDDPLFPKGLIPAYRKISTALIAGLAILGIKSEISPSPSMMERGAERRRGGARGLCFNYPAEYEVVAAGKKIVGSAQKRGKTALLQQGSIFIRQTPPGDLSCLKASVAEVNAVSVEDLLGREVSFNEVAAALESGFRKVFNSLF